MGDRKEPTLHKLEFYILSLWLLFILVIVLTVDIPICFGDNAQFIGWKNLIMRNIMPSISIGFLILTYIIYRHIKYIFKGTTALPYTITEINDKSYNQMSFLTTYIIPLICLNLSNARYQLVVLIMVVAIGAIFLKMKLYLGNPTLLLMGFNLYEIKVKGKNSHIVVISKQKLKVGKMIHWIRLDENTWYVKERIDG